MSLHKQIQEHLLQLLSNEISLDEFDEWIAQNTWNIQRNPDISAQRLAYAIELRLAEFDSGHLPEEQLRNEFSRLASMYIQVPDSQSTASSSSFTMQPWSSPLENGESMATGQLNLSGVTDEQFSKLLAIKDKAPTKISIPQNQAISSTTIGNRPGFNGIVLTFGEAEGFKLAAEILEMLAS